MPKEGRNYVANGEIGLVTKRGLVPDKYGKYHFNVEFSSQKDTFYRKLFERN